MEGYIKKLVFPVLWEIVFIATCFIWSEKYYTYTNFFFYLGIIVYFCAIGDFKIKDLKENLKNGKKFRVPVLLTSIAMMVALLISSVVSGLFPETNDGMIGLARDNWFQLVIFAISTIIFPPLAEELFFRKAFIRFNSKVILVMSSLVGMILYALEHSLAWLGIIETLIVAVPLTISYIKTKNVYIPMVAHFFVNLIGNGTTVVFTAIKLMKV